MRRHPSSIWFLSVCVLLAGCGGATNQPPPPSPTPPPGPSVTWIEQDMDHEGVKISLGRRRAEPVAAITRDGKPVANAMVFCTPLAGDSQPVEEEVATTYEPAAGKDPPLYVTSRWKQPASGPVLVRFRIVLPDAQQDFTQDTDIAR